MVGEILLILIGVALIVAVCSIIWVLLRGPDTQRRKALVALLLSREMDADGSTPGTRARERRAAKHAAWAEQLRQHAQSAHHHHYGSSSEGGHHGGGYSDHGFHGGGSDGGHGGHH